MQGADPLQVIEEAINKHGELPRDIPSIPIAPIPAAHVFHGRLSDVEIELDDNSNPRTIGVPDMLNTLASTASLDVPDGEAASHRSPIALDGMEEASWIEAGGNGGRGGVVRVRRSGEDRYGLLGIHGSM